MDNAHPGILNRQESAQFLQENFSNQLELLKDLVDYGTNLIIRCYAVSSTRDVTATVVLAVLLKQFVAFLDSTEVQVSSGCLPAASPSIRALWESSLQLFWILDSDTENRARHFHVWDLRNRLSWAKRGDSTSTEHQELIKTLQNLDPNLASKLSSSAEIAAESQRQLVEIPKILAKAENSSINQAFDVARGTKKYDRYWYQLCGANSISDMATKLGLEHEYKILYSILSETVHSRKVSAHVTIKGGNLVFEPIRSGIQIEFVTQVLGGVSFRTYRRVLEYYRPGELSNFGRKYSNSWRSAILNVPAINVNTTYGPPI